MARRRCRPAPTVVRATTWPSPRRRSGPPGRRASLDVRSVNLWERTAASSSRPQPITWGCQPAGAEAGETLRTGSARRGRGPARAAGPWSSSGRRRAVNGALSRRGQPGRGHPRRSGGHRGGRSGCTPVFGVLCSPSHSSWGPPGPARTTISSRPSIPGQRAPSGAARTIETLNAAVEARDPYCGTAAHRRVSLAIGRELALPARRPAWNRAVPRRGKIRMPDSILTKPEP
jgi:hypothetical protein